MDLRKSISNSRTGTILIMFFALLMSTPSHSDDWQTEHHDTTAEASAINIVGSWVNPKNGFKKKIETSASGFVLREASDSHPSNFAGDIEGQFQQSFSNPNVFIGRHIWGGQRTGNQRWGDERGMVLNLISETEMHLRYLDSKFSKGWTYIKTGVTDTGSYVGGYVVGVMHCSGGHNRDSTAFIVRGFDSQTGNTFMRKIAMADFINAEYASETSTNCSSKEVYSANGIVFSYDTKAEANKKYAELISRWKGRENIITIGHGYNQADWE